MDLLSIVLWLILGALAGWIASMIMGTDPQMGWAANIIVGIIGALIGGFLFGLIGAQGATGFNIWSLIVAVLGAIVLLAIVRLFRRTA
ncbi:MAG: GlsB/YeaQ/YmgE family stress response membrane protein [Candidatus Promineifilaceae bacterium]